MVAEPFGRDVSLENLKGRHVIDSTGTDFGEIDDIALDPSSWRVTGLIVNVNRDVADRLNLKRPFMGEARIQVSPERVDTFGDNVLLNVGMGDIAGMLQERR